MTAGKLRLAPDLVLPLETVTQTIGIVAKKRVGKSYLARRLMEQLLLARQQIVILDPKGDQWGIRSAADGKAPGFPVLIVGGEHGDLPLAPDSGAAVAKLVVEERVSALLDLSMLRKSELATFAGVFLEDIYRLKAQERFRTPMMLEIDEADAIAPQRPQPNELRMLGAAEDIVRRGGQRGIGCVMVTQRTAVLNKNVLTQCQMLIALRTIAPQDLKAMQDWIDVHGSVEGRKTLMESLPSLPKGDAWFWSPGWPTEAGIFQRAHVLPIETFDSGRTPEPGEAMRAPKGVAQVDLEAVKRQMAETLERAKADDPKELRARIKALEALLKAKAALDPEAADLRRQLAAANLRAQEADSQSVTRERLLVVMGQNLHKLADDMARVVDPETVEARRRRHIEIAAVVGASAVRRLATQVRASRPVAAPRAAASANGASEDLGKGERAVLTAAAQYDDGVTREQLTVLTGYKRSARDTYLSRLRGRDLVDIDGERITATQAGLDALGSDFEPLPTGDALLSFWMEKLGGGEKAILQAVVGFYPEAMTREALDEATGYKRSARDSYLTRLRSRKLIETTRDGVTASAALFGS